MVDSYKGTYTVYPGRDAPTPLRRAIPWGYGEGGVVMKRFVLICLAIIFASVGAVFGKSLAKEYPESVLIVLPIAICFFLLRGALFFKILQPKNI